VLGIGLSRTATASLNTGLQVLGFRSLHYRNLYKIISSEDLSSFDALTDTPACLMYQAVYHSFPESRFVFTERSVDQWSTSMRRLTGATSPDFEKIERWTDECVDDIGLFKESNKIKLSLSSITICTRSTKAGRRPTDLTRNLSLAFLTAETRAGCSE